MTVLSKPMGFKNFATQLYTHPGLMKTTKFNTAESGMRQKYCRLFLYHVSFLRTLHHQQAVSEAKRQWLPPE